MFGPLGVTEILFILVLALLVFGPKRLPDVGRTIGRAMGEFRRASQELRRSFNAEVALDADEPRPAVRRRIEPARETEAEAAAPPADPAATPPEAAAPPEH
jgi:sec-independent protein translocase protein TatB